MDKTQEDQERMQRFTTQVIKETLKIQGTFYLPYKTHYSNEQLLTAYPNFKNFIQIKKQLDPKNVFDSQFFQYIH